MDSTYSFDNMHICLMIKAYDSSIIKQKNFFIASFFLNVIQNLQKIVLFVTLTY